MNDSNKGSVIVLENPLKDIILANTKERVINQKAVIKEGVLNFDQTYINYLFSALGTSYLHKSLFGYGNPKIELVMDSGESKFSPDSTNPNDNSQGFADDETWNSELGDVNNIQKTASDDPDIRVRMSKEEAVRALLSTDIKQYMKDDVSNGKVQIEMIAGKVELYSKGYLDMYKALTGEDANI